MRIFGGGINMNDNIAIRLKDLKKSYGAKEVLKGINLDVQVKVRL